MSEARSIPPDRTDGAGDVWAPRTAPDPVVPAPSGPDPGRILVRNEFASISVWLRDPGGRPRLCIEDLRTGRTTELDAIELESLAWARHADLAPLLDPSLTRWAPGRDGQESVAPKKGTAMSKAASLTQKWICCACGDIYDPAEGDVPGGIPPGTPFADIPESWVCPVCGARKCDFEPYDG